MDLAVFATSIIQTMAVALTHTGDLLTQERGLALLALLRPHPMLAGVLPEFEHAPQDLDTQAALRLYLRKLLAQDRVLHNNLQACILPDQGGTQANVYTTYQSGGINFGHARIESLGTVIQSDLIHGDKIQRDNVTNTQGGAVTTGDTFTMSGDFRGAILNIKTLLTNSVQTIKALPRVSAVEKHRLVGLFTQLHDALIEVPEPQVKDAEALAESTKDLVEKATRDTRNKRILETRATEVTQMAENLATALPTLLPLARDIVMAMQTLLDE